MWDVDRFSRPVVNTPHVGGDRSAQCRIKRGPTQCEKRWMPMPIIRGPLSTMARAVVAGLLLVPSTTAPALAAETDAAGPKTMTVGVISAVDSLNPFLA